jgi:UDP-N-acetylenolpyruvoylglucosamine reductase
MNKTRHKQSQRQNKNQATQGSSFKNQKLKEESLHVINTFKLMIGIFECVDKKAP